VYRKNTVAQEALYNDKFVPIWIMLGKKHYTEIGLFSMEQLYGEIPFPLLEFIRKYRTLDLGCDGRDEDIFHEIDWIVELVNGKQQQMKLPATDEAWTGQGSLLPAFCQCRNFVYEQYTQRSDITKTQQKRQKSTTVPKREKEHSVCRELLVKSNACVEMDKPRQMTNTFFLDVLPNPETSLREANSASDDTTLEDARTATLSNDMGMDDLVDSLFDDTK